VHEGTAAVEMDGEIEAFLSYFPQKQGNASNVRLALGQSGKARKLAEAIEITTIALNKGLRPRQAEKHDLGLRPRHAQRTEGWYGTEKIAQLERAQHHDAARRDVYSMINSCFHEHPSLVLRASYHHMRKSSERVASFTTWNGRGKCSAIFCQNDRRKWSS